MTTPTEQVFLKYLDKKLLPPGSEAGAGSADRLRSSRDAVDIKTTVAEKKRDALQDRFRTLLHELMTGKVRVNDLN